MARSQSQSTTSKYLIDDNFQELLLANNGYQVMMEWEKPYMAALVNKLQPVGNVLEIGFGLGYSATEIQKQEIESHTIIECDNAVIKRAKEWAREQPHPVCLIEAKWQDVLSSLGFFDAIFLDDSPSPDSHHDMNNEEFYWFLHHCLQHHSKVGTRITWYLDNPTPILVPSFLRLEITSVPIDVPTHASYVTRQNNAMFAPLIEVIEIPKKWPPSYAVCGDGFLRDVNV